MKKEHCCAIIGQHPLRFPWGFDEEADECRHMKLELAQHIMALRQCGVTEFQIACDPGVGLYSGEIINIVREKDKAIHLTCVLPFEGQATKWTPLLRERYFNMLADCTDISYIAFHKQPNAQFLAYQHIIRQSNLLMAVYDPSLANGSAEDEAITYALVHSKQTMLIHPATWEVKRINMPKGNVTIF